MEYIKKCIKCGYEYIEGEAEQGDEIKCPNCGTEYIADWDGDYGEDSVFLLYLKEDYIK